MYTERNVTPWRRLERSSGFISEKEKKWKLLEGEKEKEKLKNFPEPVHEGRIQIL